MMGFKMGLEVVLFYFWVLFCVLLIIKIWFVKRLSLIFWVMLKDKNINYYYGKIVKIVCIFGCLVI